MDKSSAAPPMDYSEKSSMGQMPPPAYYDNPHPQSGPAYPQQPQQGFQAPPPYGGAQYGQQPQYPGQQYPGQPAAVTVQPTVYVTQAPLSPPVDDHLCYSIFTLLCCCMPLGIAALIYSISTREANHVGDRMSAERRSRTAKTLNHVALGLGIGGIVLLIVYVAVMMSVVHS